MWRTEAAAVGKRKPYPPHRIAAILRQYSQGASVAGLCDRFGMSRSTLMRWRARARAADDEQKILESENKSLRRRLSQLNAEKTLLQQILRHRR
jgi:transposase-like protein